MILFVLQTSLIGLILLSFLLVIGIPVVFALPNGWNEKKNYIILGTTTWGILVLLVGILNYFVI
jgi:photosystem II PsbZ protein